MRIIDFKYEAAIAGLPVRDKTGNKAVFGTLTAVCGSSNYRGAAKLAVSSALRCGVGIVRLCAPECVIAAAAAQIDECIYLPLPDTNGRALPDSALSSLIETVSRSSAVLAGCGLGDTVTTRSVVGVLLESALCPLIFDADSLNCLHGNPEPLKKAYGRTIITPHIVEFSRLTGYSVEDIKASPSELAQEFSNEYGCVTVLKDYITHVTAPDLRKLQYSTDENKEGIPSISYTDPADGNLAAPISNTKIIGGFSDPSEEEAVLRCGTPNSGLSKGGSGDVLAGIISSFAAQGIGLLYSAAAGCAIHSEAALRCATKYSERAMLPSDIIVELPELFLEK